MRDTEYKVLHLHLLPANGAHHFHAVGFFFHCSDVPTAPALRWGHNSSEGGLAPPKRANKATALLLGGLDEPYASNGVTLCVCWGLMRALVVSGFHPVIAVPLTPSASPPMRGVAHWTFRGLGTAAVFSPPPPPPRPLASPTCGTTVSGENQHL